ncbi:MAG: hypothetical protein E7Z90_02480 [Cyanobacteria bacterium SIG29]|nr:hypothetical protein [Cyanobacteria bacterium SIG29]
MKISPISFKSTYKLSRQDLNNSMMRKILAKKEKFDMTFTYGSYLSSEDNFFIQTPDENGNLTLNLLNKLKIPFKSLQKSETLDYENIKSRMVLSGFDDPDKMSLKNAKTNVLEQKFKESGSLYVGKNGQNGSKEKYDKIKRYLETGEPIVAPHIYFDTKNDKTTLHFHDGRHRFAVLRDLGMKEIPVAIDKNDILIAEKMGLF